MKWSAETWEEARPIYESIIEMPFIKELAAGTLPREKFMFYIAQDDLYLHDYAKALALIATRTGTAGESLAFIKFAEIALISEREMHETFFRGVPDLKGASDGGNDNATAAAAAAAAALKMEPACHHYTNFLKSTAALEAPEVAMAAVLPCFWIYREVGAHIHKSSVPGNPYQAWIDTYVGEEFDRLVDSAVDICDAAAVRSTPEGRKAMTRAYVTASRLEFDFWDAAYRLRKW